jgi:hypothetical protein
MHSSISRADAATHFKIAATALLAVSAFVFVGLSARVSSAPLTVTTAPPSRALVPAPGMPAPATLSIARLNSQDL